MKIICIILIGVVWSVGAAFFEMSFPARAGLGLLVGILASRLFES